MSTLREELTASVKNAADAYEAKMQDLVSSRAGLDALREALGAREGELNERERIVANRENALDEVRKVAANRKAEIETLKKQVSNANALRSTAVAECRVAREEQARLEGLVGSLIADKKALLAEIEALEQRPLPDCDVEPLTHAVSAAPALTEAFA
jgi:chromosome segregation ATPase